MADVYEKNLAQKTSLTTSDYIRVVGSDNVSYKQLVSDVAKKIIETYTGSSLAGSAQSVKAALDSLNSKRINKPVANGASLNISCASARFLLTFIGGVQGARGMYIVAGYTSSIERRAVLEAPSLEITQSGTTLSITNNSGYSLNVCIDIYSGSVSFT